MGTYFSNHFGTGVTTTLAGVDAILQRDKKIGAGEGGARERYKRASIVVGTGDGAIGDVLRMMKFKSGDRIKEILVSTSGGSAGAGDIGLYKTGREHTGAVIDVDLFASAVTLSGTVARVDQFKESTTLKDIDRGKTLWELVTIGTAATYTSDPMEDWDLCVTMTTAVTVSLMTINLEVLYTSGD